MKNKFTSTLIVTGFLLFGAVTANADQVFLFSDDLSAQFDIEKSQTSAKFASGRFYTADDSVSSAVASKIIANPFRTIISARLDVSETLPSSTRTVYYVSNNNGLRWMQVNPGYTYSFDSAGNELRWRAVITRESPFIASAHIDSVSITYTVSDSVAPSSSMRPNNGSLSTVLYGGGGDLNSFVCDALSSIGLGCGAPQKVATSVYGQAGGSQLPFSPSDTPQEQPKKQQTNIASSTGSLQASIADTTVKRTVSDDEVILVKVPAVNGVKQTLGLNTNDAIFEIIRGQKHFIPTVDIFFDYGFDLNAVQGVTHKDLESFPRAKLVNVYKDSKKTYYITEGGMIRLIPNRQIFESYGDREEDIISISKKEFNFYPRNQYIFLESPLSGDVFQIVNDGTKRYIVSDVVKRLKIRQGQIAPVNKAQLDAYKNSLPIIF